MCNFSRGDFTMKTGWNFEYLELKKRELQDKLEKVENIKQKKQIEEEIDLCDYLSIILLFSEGQTITSDITMKQFVEEIYQQAFSYPIPVIEQEKIENFALSFLKLPKLKIERAIPSISSTDSIRIVGDFIKDQFHEKHYQLYKNVFMDHSNYVLFDQNTNLSSAISLDGEMFVRIKQSNDMEMLSSIAHEMGHLYRMSNNSHMILTNSYREYESFFYEFHFLLWLIKNHIYSKEAANYFLQLFDILEKVSYMRYCIQNYQLNQIASSKQFTKEINKLHLRRDLHFKKNQDLFDLYITALDMDLQTYFHSFMAVMNHMDDFDQYEQVIKEIKNRNESTIQAKILTKNKNSYQSYVEYRRMLQDFSED